ncbi:MAG: hypothetical protein R3Y43_01380 [Alphaproteobacteria bacterium]
MDITKEYMTITEVANLWDVPLEDIRYLGEEGELTICIRRIPMRVAIESILEKSPYLKSLPKKSKEIMKLLDEPQPLHPTDIYLLFANKDRKIKINRLKTLPLMNIVHIKTPDIEVGFEDMIITASERKRFEFERTNKILKESICEPLTLKSSDFTCIELYGETFSFGEKQAIIIKYLYDRYYSGDPWVHGKTLLAKANSESYKLANLFNKHHSWRKAIISNGRGYYRINLPFAEPAPTRRSNIDDTPSLFDNLD